MKSGIVFKSVGLILSFTVMSVFMLTSCGKAGSGQQNKEDVVVSDTQEETDDAKITDEQAVEAVKKYCFDSNPDLEDIVNAGEYQVSWEVESSGEDEIVVLFRSYTGAEVRYYIDPVSGETYVTEFVSGITDEEERTDESINIRDYLE